MSEWGRSLMQDKLDLLVRVTECRGKWYKGTRWIDPITTVEFSFELPKIRLMDTYLSYFGVWTPKKCLFEFQFDQIAVKPNQEFYQGFIIPVFKALKDYNPPHFYAD